MGKEAAALEDVGVVIIDVVIGDFVVTVTGVKGKASSLHLTIVVFERQQQQ